MTKKITTSEPTDSEDEILNLLMSDCASTLDKIETTSNDHAALILGVKFVEDQEHGPGVITCIAASGYYGILEEGLYSELAEMLDQGDLGLFNALRNAIRSIEEDFNIDPNEELDDTGSASTLH